MLQREGIDGLTLDGVGWTYGAHMTERSEGRWARPSPTSISIHQDFCEPINQPIRLIFVTNTVTNCYNFCDIKKAE